MHAKTLTPWASLVRYSCVLSQCLYVRRDPFILVSWLNCMCDVSSEDAHEDSCTLSFPGIPMLVCVTWLMRSCVKKLSAENLAGFKSATFCLKGMRTRTHIPRASLVNDSYVVSQCPYVWHDSFVCVPWHSCIYDLSSKHARKDFFTWCFPGIAFLCVKHSATHCNTLQHTATHCNTLQHTATHYVCAYPWFRIRVCEIIHFYVWNRSFLRVTWLIPTCDMTHFYVWNHSFLRVTWLIPTCNMTHSYVWHDSFLRVTWLIPTCKMTHSYVWHDSFLRVKSLIPTCDMTHSFVWHDSFLLLTWLTYTLHTRFSCFNHESENF